MISIKDIAALAGVSIGTVDRILHDRGGVKPATAERVRKIIRESGYSSNITAQMMKMSGKDYSVALLINTTNYKNFSLVFDSCLRTLANSGFARIEYKVFDFRDGSPEDMLRALKAIREEAKWEYVIGIFAEYDDRIIQEAREMTAEGIKIITNNGALPLEGVTDVYVGSDYDHAGKTAAGYLNNRFGTPIKAYYLESGLGSFGKDYHRPMLLQLKRLLKPHIELKEIYTGDEIDAYGDIAAAVDGPAVFLPSEVVTLKAANKYAVEHPDCVVISLSNSELSRRLLYLGEIEAALLNDMDDLGVYAAYKLLKAINPALNSETEQGHNVPQIVFRESVGAYLTSRGGGGGSF